MGLIYIDRHNTLTIRSTYRTTLISIFGFALISFLDPKDLILYLLIIFITGVGVGVDLIIPQAELANLLDNNKKNNRLSQIFSTLFSILKKLAIGLAAGISLTGYGLMEENNISFIFYRKNIFLRERLGIL